MTDRRSNVPPITPSPERDEASVTMSRGAFAAWLRAAREGRGIGLEEIARVTKIQLRTLERLEEARFDELPADVFVRGFIKNYARVVGLDANEALARYDDCGTNPGPAATARAKAMADLFEPEPRNKYAQGTPPQGTTLKPPSMAAGSLQMPAQVAPAAVPVPVIDPFVIPTAPTPEPVRATPAPIVVETTPAPLPVPAIETRPEPAIDATEAPKRGKGRRRKNESKKRTTGRTAAKKIAAPVAAPTSGSAIEVVDLSELEPEIEVIFEPEPAPAPVRVRPAPIPTLVIDDADPDSAEREQEMRAREKEKEKEKRSFLPQALLDNDRGSRQGGLTLAVIILLIVATLTLSYLMRRPSSSGEGVTMHESNGSHVTLAS